MQGVLTQTMRFSVVIKAFLEAGDDKKGVPNHRKAPPQCTKYAPRLAESPGACIRTCAASIVDMRLAPSECPKGQVTEPARGTPTPLKRNFFAWHAAPGPPLENCSSESRYGTHCTPCPCLPAQDLLWASGLPLFDPSQRRRQHRRRATYSRELTAGLSLHTEPPLSLITLPPPRAAMESESGIKAAGVGAAHAPLPR